MRNRLLIPGNGTALEKLDRQLHGKPYRESHFVVVVDANSRDCCLPQLRQAVDALRDAPVLEVPVGEAAKSASVAAELWEALLQHGIDSHGIIVNLGGGCVSDIGGFVAATYHRGVRHINVPTTLIGMADAAIGGKTAIDVGHYKNPVGLFHHPEMVCIQPDLLGTLPRDEWTNGCFEMLKSFLLSDHEGLERLEADLLEADPFTPQRMGDYVLRCAAFKRDVVKVDPHDFSLRHMLNLGHTFGHAIESLMMERGEPVPHGIAVGVGLVAELYLSWRKLGLERSVLDDYLRVAGKHITLPTLTLRDTERALRYLRADKKNVDGSIRCVLLQAVGVPVVDVPLDENEARDALLQIGRREELGVRS